MFEKFILPSQFKALAQFIKPLAISTTAVSLFCSISFAQPPVKQPRLILQITIDQLRGDIPFRYYDRLPDTDLYRSVLNNFNPVRSGDIYIVFESHWFINEFDGLTVTATHGSPWQYDTFVPIIFAGAGIPAKHIYRRTYTIDVAPTLSRYVGAKPPSSSSGVVLEEIFGQ